jgi:L-alanine-DL-glutamate epimerase-like enolase superfamily enzyme
MKIARVEAVPVRVPRAKPMRSAANAGAEIVASDFGIVRVHTDEALVGIGEISMNLGRTGACQCAEVEQTLGPALIGRDASDIQGAVDAMNRILDDSGPAKAGVEMALFDLVGKELGVPVFRLLGGRVRESAPVRWGLGFGPPADGVAELEQWIDRGFHAIKLKVGRPGTGLDEAMVAAVRSAFGDSITIVVDANGGYATPMQAVQELAKLEPYGLQLIEQPLPRSDLDGLAYVRSRLNTPVLADESMRHPRDAYAIAQAKAADVLSVYVCEAGGLIAAAKAFAIGEAAGLPCTLGSQCELGVGTSAMAHLAVAMPNLAFESDITGHLRYPQDIIVETLRYENGRIFPPDGPGLGVTLDEDALSRWRIRDNRPS